MSETTPTGHTRTTEDLLADLADDFLRRHRAGENPSVDQYCARHPEAADRIRELFPAVLAMERPGLVAALDAAPPAERVGATIGRYKLLERIGEGGFGVVYMAEQHAPVRRKVALKVIKPGIDTRHVIARFEAERQALAMMDHENIARVLDAGATDAGRPYFVMELVHGVPITEYCDKNELPPRQRLELFVQVCRAVQHAHTKGIIHRDLKPTNVLVTLHEGVPVPKVIDFGVAKATGQQLTDKTLFTHFQQMVGTPLYMSPEQAEMTGVDVDTRSDVYSLGVVLYELLTGTTPVDKERMKSAAFDEVRRIIREEDPPRPSTRLSTMGEQARSVVAAQRRSDPKQLGRLMRRELDWIVMKALEKQRARRYETANALAKDVERYLSDDPVEACPPSVTYRLRKLGRRNRRALATASLAGALLLAGAAGALVYAAQQRRLAADRNQFATDQGEALRRLGEDQKRTQADLYQALLRQSVALRQSRQPGYRPLVWANLHQAAALPACDPQDIRREVLACLGDPLGLEPVGAAPARRPAPLEIPERLRPWVPPDSNVRTAVAPGGMLLAVHASSVTLRGAGGEVLATTSPPLGDIMDLKFTSDGRFLVAGCGEGVAVWTAPDLRPFTFYRGHTAYSVAGQPGGHLIASAGPPGAEITLWSLRSNRTVATLRLPPAASTVEFSADGKLLLAVGGERALAAWHVGDTPEKLELPGHDGAVPTLAFSPDGTLIASAGKDRKLKVWDAQSGALRHTGEGHEAGIESVAFSPDGALVASGDYSGSIRFWDVETGREVGRANSASNTIWRLQFDRSGQYLAAAVWKGVAAWTIRRQHGTVTADEFLFLPSDGGVLDMAIHPGGAGLVWREEKTGLSAYDLPQARRRTLPASPLPYLRTLHFDPQGDQVRFPSAGERLGVVGWSGNRPADAADIAVIGTIAGSADGRWLATLDPTYRQVIVSDFTSGREWAVLPPQGAEIWALNWSPDGTRLAAGLTNGGVVVWDLEQVRARLAEFGINLPSTAAGTNISSPPLLTGAAFEEILTLHGEGGAFRGRQRPPSSAPATPGNN